MDKYINKFIENPWFIRIVALVVALLLFENVQDERNETAVNVPQDQQSETIEEVPVTIYYDTETLVVSGVPETVTLTLSGPKTSLQQARIQRGFEVYVDLTDAKIGTQKVPIQIREISDNLKVTINPDSATVSVQEKVTEEFNVEAEFSGSQLADGYISDQAIIEPKKVTITGAKDIIDKIGYVKAALDTKGEIKETIKQKADILVLDNELNKLNVVVEPNQVEVTIPIKAASKTVPIRLEQSGTPPDGVTIESVTLEQTEATIIAPEEVLNRTDSVRVELDVSKIEEDTVLTQPVIISEGIVEVNPKTIKLTVSVSVSETEDKTISNLPIKIEGLAEEYMATFREPSSGSSSLTVSGMREVLQQLNSSDFTVFVDVSALEEGDHTVDINVNGPEDISWQLDRETARISITQKEA
ncbi:YbbR-like domain-containing protein [Bacillus dakarensis]|uniref:CdaR family protein n=1 Tax=Robertmurraya dakarensis TaxID=1926278 RepID=UPI00098259C2|nr:CdaR family protein [Bacillus dakarensis]